MQEDNSRFLGINAKSNGLDYLESAAGFLRRTDDFKWKWVAIAVYDALYSLSILALDKGNPSWVISPERPKDIDKGRFCRWGSDVKWYKSRIELIGKGPAYRIIWDETDEEPQISETPEDPFAWPKGKLIGFFTTLARIQDERSISGSKHVTISDEELKAIQWLALRVRNELIHFAPKTYGIEIKGIRVGCLAAIKVIEALIFETQALWTVEEIEKMRARESIAALRLALITPA